MKLDAQQADAEKAAKHGGAEFFKGRVSGIVTAKDIIEVCFGLPEGTLCEATGR